MTAKVEPFAAAQALMKVLMGTALAGPRASKRASSRSLRSAHHRSMAA
jgi:hypothetical protein